MFKPTQHLVDIILSPYIFNTINNQAFLNMDMADFMAAYNVRFGRDLSILEVGPERLSIFSKVRWQVDG